MGSKPESRVEGLLAELCTRYGYCLPPAAAAALAAEAPTDADAFVSAVLAGEGLDPELTPRKVRQELAAVVRRWLFDGP